MPPGLIGIYSGASSEWRLSLLASLHTRWRAPLADRLNRRGGHFLDSAFALFWSGERSRSGELPDDSSSSTGGSLSPLRMGSLPLFDIVEGARWICPRKFLSRLVSKRASRRSFSCCKRFTCSRNSAMYLAYSSCFSSISWHQWRN